MIGRPGADEFGPYYRGYIDLVEGDDLLAALRAPVFADALRGLDPALGAYAYAPGKWTLAQSVQHVIDTERVFAARALRIGRGDTTPLPGFDQDAYAVTAPTRPLGVLADVLDRLRGSTLDVFGEFTEADRLRIGTASGNPLSPRAAGWIIAGHERHHLTVLQERYLG